PGLVDNLTGGGPPPAEGNRRVHPAAHANRCPPRWGGAAGRYPRPPSAPPGAAPPRGGPPPAPPAPPDRPPRRGFAPARAGAGRPGRAGGAGRTRLDGGTLADDDVPALRDDPRRAVPAVRHPDGGRPRVHRPAPGLHRLPAGREGGSPDEGPGAWDTP